MRVYLARYTPSGALDTLFGDAGVVLATSPPPPPHQFILSLGLRSTGAIVFSLVSAVLGPEGLVIDGLGQKPSADGRASKPVLDLGVFGCP